LYIFSKIVIFDRDKRLFLLKTQNIQILTYPPFPAPPGAQAVFSLKYMKMRYLQPWAAGCIPAADMI